MHNHAGKTRLTRLRLFGRAEDLERASYVSSSVDMSATLNSRAKIRECLDTAHRRDLPPGILLPRIDNIWAPPTNPCTIEFANDAAVGPPVISICASLYVNSSVPETPFEIEIFDRRIEPDGAIFAQLHHLEGWSDPRFGVRHFASAHIVATELGKICRCILGPKCSTKPAKQT